VFAGLDHDGATVIEIGNALTHQAVFDAAGFRGVTLSADMAVIEGTGGTDFARNVEWVSLVKPGGLDTTADTVGRRWRTAGGRNRANVGVSRKIRARTDVCGARLANAA
jgi:hypothetical protein